MKQNKTMLLLALLAAVLVVLNLIIPDRQQEPATVESPAFSQAPVRSEDADKIVISELMIKNRACLMVDGGFPDWIELYNRSEETVSLEGWAISDREGERENIFPDISLAPGERLLVYADKKGGMDALHAGFALSEGESVYLYDQNGSLACSVPCGELGADVSLSLCDDGQYSPSLYPTPGQENSAAGYEAVQSALETPAGLSINEVAVASYDRFSGDTSLDCDWVELKNNSDSTVELGDYFLSDDEDDLRKCPLPGLSLAPGELCLLCCDEENQFVNGYNWLKMALNSSSEELYLSCAEGIVDYVSLRDIPYACSYGRVPGENGWFYFAEQSPAAANGTGYRRVSAAPTALGEEGVFENVSSVSVELQGKGEIYYTTDGSYPTAESALYTGAISLSETGVVRAIAVEEGAMPSRALTLNYFINEGHSLPVVSLVSDSEWQFEHMYTNGRKNFETPGSLSLYEQGGSFTIPCGIKMHGETSLKLMKKNMSVRFRGSYGQETLSYDLFGGGVTEFTNLVLRAGQDQYGSIIRNELFENLALQGGSAAVSTRSEYCVVYINGRYSGIYALSEKSNEQLYASLAGVSRESVECIEGNVWQNTELYDEVFRFCYENDLSKKENYEHICSVLDVDSLIDWAIFEGYSGNDDLNFGNVRYCRSTENDGKWRLMFYDLDAGLRTKSTCFYNVLSFYSLHSRQPCTLLNALMDNEQFRQRFLERASELLNGALSDESVLKEIDRLEALLQPEVARNFVRYGRDEERWHADIDYLRSLIEDGWRDSCVDALCDVFSLNEQQRAEYFGE